MAVRNYSNITNVGTLSGAVGTGETTLPINSGWSNLPAFPFYIIVDRGSATEECMLATGGNATALNVTRGYDGSPASSHGISATVEHAVLAEFFAKADQHVEASTNVHGLSGGSAVAGTSQAQTLTNKTINASVLSLAHSTSPAATKAVEVAADAATARDGFVWTKTAGATGAAFKATSSGTTRFTVDADGKVVLNSGTGTDKALAVQESTTERFSILNDGTADFGLQQVGATADRVTIRNRPTQTALRIRDASAASVFSVGSAGNVDASGYIASATNVSATGALSSGTTTSVGSNLTVGGTAAVTGISTLTGDVTLPLPASGTTPRLNIRGRTGGTLIEGKDQAGTVTYSMGVDGGGVANGKWFIHDKNSSVLAAVTGTGQVPSPVNGVTVFDLSDNFIKRYDTVNGWRIVGDVRFQDGLARYTRTTDQVAAIVANTWTRQAFNVAQSTTADVSPNGSFDQFTINRSGVYRIISQVRPLTTSTPTHRYLIGVFPGATPGTNPYAIRSYIEPDSTITSTNIGVEVERRFSSSDVICIAARREPYGGAGAGTNSNTEAQAESCHISISYVRP